MKITTTSSLTELANRYGSDKGTIGPDSQWPVHNYTDVYEAFIGHLRDQPVNLLEIGLGIDGDKWRAYIAIGRNEGGGGSMKMWRDYFHCGRIFGVDINPASFLDSDRVKTYVVDQGNASDLARFQGELGDIQFDVIVDDGSHRPDHQQITLGSLFSMVKPGGMYFVEDLMNNGKGDPAYGRYSANDVLNTRKVLKGLSQSGTLPEPHKILNAEEFVAGVAAVSFHCPAFEASAMPAFLRKMMQRPRIAYMENSETLCAIRKV